MNTPSLRPLLGLVLLAAPVAAQLGAAEALPPLLVPIHTADADQGMPYGIWAGTCTYKVGFAGGMTFIPYLGEHYPHNQPWSWRTTSVRVGATELLAPETNPAPRHTALRYEYDFGPVVEAYDVRTDGVEQTFVIHELPAAGDLVVTGIVTSALRAIDVDAAHQALVFHDAAGTPIVRYGEATAIDAAGRRLPITTAHARGVVTLTVPAAWLEHAALPVVVDPLTAPTSPGTTTVVIKNVDVSYKGVDVVSSGTGPPNVIGPRVLHVLVLGASQFDDDVVAVSSAWGGNTVFADTTPNWDSDDASCAVLEDSDTQTTGDWLIAWRRYFALNPIRTSQLRFHAVPTLATTLSTTSVGLVNAVGINDWRPDTGGVATTGDRALVVFQREDNTNTAGHWGQTTSSGVYGVFVDLGPGTPSDGVVGTPFPIFDTTNGDAERPSVNPVAAGGTSFSWACAMQIYDHSLATDDWDVHVRRITHTGLVTLAMWQSQLGPQNTLHQLAPVIAGSSGRYAVAFATTDVASSPGPTGLSRGKAIQVERIDWDDGTSAPTPSHAPATLASDATTILEATGLAYDRGSQSHWAIGYRRHLASAPAVFAARVGYRGIATEGPLQLTGAADTATSPVRCTVDMQFGGFQFAYGVQTGAAFLALDRDLQYVTPAGVTLTGSSCSNATIAWVGSGIASLQRQQIGSQFTEVTSAGLSPQTAHVMGLSLATADLAMDVPGLTASGCRLLIDAFGPDFLGVFPAATGLQVSWSLPLPEFVSPTTLHFQAWMLDGTVLTSGRRLSVPIVR